MIQLTVNNCTKLKDGYRVTLKCADKIEKGTPVILVEEAKTPLGKIYAGIERVFGITKEGLKNSRSDYAHTDARKVYSHIRREMGYQIVEIAQELCKHRASVIHYLSDNSDRIMKFKEDVLNG